MKQSSGRVLKARPLSRNAALGIAAVAAVVLAACGGKSHDACPNLPQAVAEIGQAGFTVAQPSTAVSAATIGGLQGSAAVNGSALYVADTNRNRVLGYSSIPTSSGASATFVLGQNDLNSSTPGIGPDGSLPIRFSNPSRVWVDPSSTYLVVTDTSNNRVLIWTPVPTSSTEAPKVVVGQPDFTHNDVNYVASGSNLPAANNLNNPTSAIIANGKLIVVDKGNNRVLIWKAVPTAALASADFVLGQSNMTTNTPSGDIFNNATQAYTIGMRQPTDAWSAGAQLLVTDTNNQRVLVYNNIPNTTNPTADNVIGQSGIGSIVQTPGTGSTGLNTPWSVTSDGNNIFVADSGNNRILEYVSAFGRNQQAANYVFGQDNITGVYAANDPDQNNQVGDQRNNPATIGPTAGTLNNPRGVTLTSSGQLIVSDTANSRVMVYTASSGVDGTRPQVPCTP